MYSSLYGRGAALLGEPLVPGLWEVQGVLCAGLEKTGVV